MTVHRGLFMLTLVGAIAVSIGWVARQGSRDVQRMNLSAGATVPVQGQRRAFDEASAPHDAEQALSPEEKKVLAVALQTAEKSLQRIERANSTIKAKIEGAEYFKEVAMITEPTLEQYAECSVQISKAFEGLPEHLKVRAYTDQSRLLSEYTSFKAPFRVIVHGVSKPAASDKFDYYNEKYVGGEDSVVIEGEKLTITDVRADRSRADGNIRYGYLFSGAD